MKNTEIDMTKGKIFSNIIRFSIPIILSNLLQITFNTADIAVVGQFCGSNAVAAIGATSPLVHLLINMFIGIAVGVTVTVSHSLGAKKYEDSNKYAHTAVAAALICGIIIAVAGSLIARSALKMMGTPEGEVLDGAVIYFKIYTMGAPVLLLYNFSAAIVKANGDSQKPFIFLTIGGILNVILNLIFVLIFSMTVDGVALATVIANMVSALLTVRYLINCDNPCKIKLKNIKISKHHLNSILKFGLPVCIQNSMFSIPNMMIQSYINLYGVAAVAGNSAASNVGHYLDVIGTAASEATINFVSRNFGAKLYDRIKKSVKIIVVTSSLLSLFFGIMTYILRVPVLSIFIPGDTRAIEYGSIRLMYLIIPYIIACLMTVFNSALRGLGKPVMPMVISIFSVFVVRILWLIFIYPFFPSIQCVYFTFPFTWSIACVILGICYHNTYKKISLKD